MKTGTRWAVLGLVVAVAVVAFVIAQSGGGSNRSSKSKTTQAQAPAGGTAVKSTATSATPAPKLIVVKGEKPWAASRTSTSRRGDQVRFTVQSDSAQEITSTATTSTRPSEERLGVVQLPGEDRRRLRDRARGAGSADRRIEGAAVTARAAVWRDGRPSWPPSRRWPSRPPRPPTACRARRTCRCPRGCSRGRRRSSWSCRSRPWRRCGRSHSYRRSVAGGSAGSTSGSTYRRAQSASPSSGSWSTPDSPGRRPMRRPTSHGVRLRPLLGRARLRQRPVRERLSLVQPMAGGGARGGLDVRPASAAAARGRRRSPTRRGWGTGRRVAGIVAFAWVELCYQDKNPPRDHRRLIVAYAVTQLAAMAVFGAETWSRRGEPRSGPYFGVF